MILQQRCRVCQSAPEPTRRQCCIKNNRGDGGYAPPVIERPVYLNLPALLKAKRQASVFFLTQRVALYNKQQ
jgi:hypothetical protein